MKIKILSALVALSTALAASSPAFAAYSSANYEIERVDSSVFDSRGKALLKQYYDKVVLLDQNDSATKINKALNEACAAEAALFSQFAPQNGDTFKNFYEPTVTKNKDGIFSIKVESEHWSGGGYTAYVTKGLNFNLNTGAKLSPHEALGMSSSKALGYMKERSLEYMAANKNVGWYPNATELINDMSFEPDFYVEGDSLFLCYYNFLAHPNNGTIIVECPKDNVEVFFRGKEIAFDQPPVVKNDRTMVPIRAIFEALGYNLTWNQEEQTAYADHGSRSIAVTVGKNEIKHSGGTFVSDVPAINLSGRVMVPVRAISELSGYTVTWDQANLAVNIK